MLLQISPKSRKQYFYYEFPRVSDNLTALNLLFSIHTLLLQNDSLDMSKEALCRRNRFPTQVCGAPV